MIIVGVYSFSDDKGIIRSHFGSELREIECAIAAVNPVTLAIKDGSDNVLCGRTPYRPKDFRAAFRQEFEARGWQKHATHCEYSANFYVQGYVPIGSSQGVVREIDWVKNRAGVEVQFSRYASVVYDICAKMTIFHKLGIIDVGVQIVPIKDLADQISPRALCFEQVAWDLEHRGVSDIDIPMFILGITA